MCLCPSMSNLSSLSSTLAKNADSKYYQEIGAEMISNQLIIRLEKDKNRQKKKRAEWDPPCDCVEIQRPTSKRGPKIINANCDDRIVFRVHSASRLNEKKELPYKPQTIGYKVFCPHRVSLNFKNLIICHFIKNRSMFRFIYCVRTNFNFFFFNFMYVNSQYFQYIFIKKKIYSKKKKNN